MEFLKILNIFFLKLSLEVKSKQPEHKKKIKTFGDNLALNNNFEQYSRHKNELEALFEKIADS